ncbi:N-acetylglucosamine-6-phosphate deacetylase [Rhodopirellula halodulae]|uniref:N-acetylglucosamine-6-phosphate deacetylase n=1 Tax=Rhodopirellula halodulae TaxID=2894198 RepID=UPI001E5F9E88|nr:N-acetylglucosamine-6-phosphate deacetylase [Rhodopirellula sp. JC737]MCC9655746.1 N-acetylglucosamine-6-phosphate deacetylase [Rhodopirellula sp. JC737]
MRSICFFNGTAILPDRVLPDAVVFCRGERIVYVGRARSRVPKSADMVDVKGGFISPGFVDIHIHGGGGADVMDASPEAIATVCQAHARHGTTCLFPTTSTGTDEQIHAMLSACDEVRTNWDASMGSKIAGVHLYGPYFAKDKVGCHDDSVCRAPKSTEYRRYFKTGIVKIATCAAELAGASAFYRHATQQGCLVTCGHSNASWDEMGAAFKNGMRHVDHFWCAMSNVSSVRKRFGFPMRGSMLEYVLSNPEMSTEVIADGMHLSPELLHFAWKMKGSDRLCLVTDCNRALDMPPGCYRFGPESNGSWFTNDGNVGWAPEGSLASSVMGMDHMVRTMHRNANIPLHEVVRMASLTPAERAGIDAEVGSLTPGKRADIILLNKSLQVKRVHINGQRIRNAT